MKFDHEISIERFARAAMSGKAIAGFRWAIVGRKLEPLTAARIKTNQEFAG